MPETVRTWKSLVEEKDPDYWAKLAAVPVYKFSNEREFKEPQRPGEAYKWLST